MTRPVARIDLAGTRLVVRANPNALTGAGGVAADPLTNVPSAGGALPEWLEGRELPGVATLIQNERV